MRKKIGALFCALCMIFAMLPMTAYTAGNLEGVDYSRISAGKGYPVQLLLGDLEFLGELSRGFTLSDSEQDNIIRQVMVDQNVTSGMLVNAPSFIAKVEAVEGFSMKDATNAILKLAGVSDLLDLYNIIMGSYKPKTEGETIKDMAMDQVKNQGEEAVENALTKGGKVALRGGGKLALKLFFLLPDLTEIGLGALSKYDEIKETVALALEKKIMLERFYAECNKRIAEASGDDGEWKISFIGRGGGVTATHDFNMWGIGGLMSQWTLTGELVRSSTGSGNGYAGTYEGDLLLDIKGLDMTSTFDARFIDTSNKAVRNQIAVMSGTRENMQYTSKTNSPTVLTRSIVWHISATVSEGSGEFLLNLNSFQTSKDEQNISINQTVEGYGSFSSPGGTTERWDEIAVVATTLESCQATYRQWTAVTSQVPGHSHPKTELESPDIITVDADPGTAWKPLENQPTLAVITN